MPNRQKAEAVCLSMLEELMPGSPMPELYKKKFASMDDAAFATFMQELGAKTTRLVVIDPNFGSPTSRLDFERNLKLGEKWGYKFFQRVKIPAINGLPSYLTPIPYLNCDMPYRRQAQLLDDKISVPEDNLSVDDFTGQVTGKSKSSSISYPQVQVLAARNKPQILTEFLKYRGGDQKGFHAMNTMIARTGGVSLKAIEPFAGGVRSTQTLGTILKAMHLQHTL